MAGETGQGLMFLAMLGTEPAGYFSSWFTGVLVVKAHQARSEEALRKDLTRTKESREFFLVNSCRSLTEGQIVAQYGLVRSDARPSMY